MSWRSECRRKKRTTILWRFLLPVFLACFLSLHLISSNPNPEDSLRKALVTAPDDNKKVEIYLSLAKLVKTRSADSSLLFLDRALKICWKTSSLGDLGEIFLLKGELSNMKNNPREALRQFKIAEFIFRKIGDKKRQAIALNWSGTVYDYNTPVNISESFRYRLRALGIAEEIKDTFLLAMVYNNLAGVFISTGNSRSGIDYYKKAKKIWELMEDSVRMPIVNMNLGSAYVNTDKLDSSRACFEKAIPVFRARNEQLYMQICLVLLSYSSVKEERYTEAMDYLDQATTYVLTFGEKENHILSKRVLSDINVLKGLINYRQGSYSLAKTYLLQGYRLLDSLGDYRRIGNIAEPLCEIYEKSGKPDSAIFVYRQVKIKSDSLLKNQISNFGKLAVVQIEYDREIREKQMQLLYRQTIQRRNLMIFIGSGILLISLILILILRLRLERQKKMRVDAEKRQALLEKQQAMLEKETADLKLESQTREMAMNAMSLIRKNELILDISDRLIPVIEASATFEGMRSQLLKIVSTMQKIKDDNAWEEFELRFKQVHDNFYTRLLEKCPELSHSELKLCALLKLNLSTKEISELSGQQPATIDVARYRLRKKLGISKSQVDLVSYLSKI
jgi:tetratricopeptide (TPR) repeat protein